MKRKGSILLLIVLVLVSLGGCKKKGFDIAGKTYYNTTDNYGNEDHSKVWFGKDGNFVLTDNFAEGTYQANGTWSLQENVITLKVDSSQVNVAEKIIYEIQDEDNIVLKTGLAGSKAEEIFSTKEIKGSTVSKDDTVPENNKTNATYYNASQKARGEFDYSTLELYSDGSFKLTEVQGMGAIEISGRYGIEGDAYMFSNFEPFTDYNGNTVYNFELLKDGDALIMNEDLQGSRKGDYFTIDGSLPQGITVDVPQFGDLLFIHEAIADVNPMYLPQVVFANDDTFVFTENLYAGMGDIKGTYVTDASGYTCTVTDISQLQGFMGQDVKQIIFTYGENSTLILQTDICMSQSGDVFELN